MFATLLAVLVALALGHLAPTFAAAVREHGWFTRWLRWLDARVPHGIQDGRSGVLLALLPPLLLVALLQLALGGIAFGLPALAFGIVALFHAWGPRDLDVDVDAVIDAPDAIARHAAAARLWPPGEAASLDGAVLVGAVFRQARRRWFGVLFWFLLLGPSGALLYRLAAVAAEDRDRHLLPAGTLAGARGLLRVLDWPVTQLITLAMALVGDFDAVFGAWRERGGAALSLDDGYLAAAARACVRIELAEERAEAQADAAFDDIEADFVPPPPVVVHTDLPELRDAMGLAWRVLLVWLAAIALFVVAGWVG